MADMRDGREWDEDQTKREAHFDLWPEKVPIARLQIEPRELKEREGTNDHAEREQFARIEFRHDEADDGHGDEGAQSARGHGNAGAQGGITEQSLQRSAG